MAEHLEQFFESAEDYISTKINEKKDTFELGEISKKDESKSQESLLPTKQRQSSWSKPLLFITVLLCLILILLLILLGAAGWFAYDNYFATRNSTESTDTATGASSSTNEWADRIAQNVYEKLRNTIECTNTATGAGSELADNIAQEVSQKLINNLIIPDFNEWANDVVSQVSSNVTGSLPDFNEWANGVVSKVNSSVTGSLPNFNEWANGVVSKVNSNVTGILPDFNEWANGVVSKVNSSVTGSLPDFNEWANGVVSKVNSNVTGSLPDFNEWSNGVVSKVNSNVTGSLPDFNEWANSVSQNTLQLFQNNTNFTELDKQILQATRDSAQKLINIVNTLSNLQDTSTSTAGVVDEILLIAQELLVLHNNSTASPTSCKEIKERQPLSPSGVYLLSNSTDTYTAYCNMEELCNSTGGWTRLAYLDMTNATQNCPSGFGLYQSGGVRACGKQTQQSGCVSVQFPSHDISYSQVCGRVTGYLFGSIDALNSDQDFDGVSITRGCSRQKVWSFIAGYSELGFSSSSCPCNTGSFVPVPSSIGNNYFCESGNPDGSPSQILYTSDPLWDGQGCGSDETACCNVPGIPWFHRDYGNTTTTDYIELRLCADGGGGEDSPVSYYEIYVK